MTKTVLQKRQTLHNILKSFPRLAVALSGGVDSVLLLLEAVEVLGARNVAAITVYGNNFPTHEGDEAESLAKSLGVIFIPIQWDPFSVAQFVLNDPERCYHCKKALYSLILAQAASAGFTTLADGANASDAGDYRPGSIAAKELGVQSPLALANLEKHEIRTLLEQRKHPLWNKPAIACLATRIPTGTPITPEALKQIEKAEAALHSLGFNNIRVRHHGDLARIEVDADERRRFASEEIWDRVAQLVEDAGYRYAALDLHGYRRGNMNKAAEKSQ